VAVGGGAVFVLGCVDVVGAVVVGVGVTGVDPCGVGVGVALGLGLGLLLSGGRLAVWTFAEIDADCTSMVVAAGGAVLAVLSPLPPVALPRPKATAKAAAAAPTVITMFRVCMRLLRS
jgi:hypothetical protein